MGADPIIPWANKAADLTMTIWLTFAKRACGAQNSASRIQKTLYCCRLDSQDYAKPYSGHNSIPATRALWDVRDFQLNTGFSTRSASIERNRPSSASLPARHSGFFPDALFYRVFRKSGSAHERIVPPGPDSPVSPSKFRHCPIVHPGCQNGDSGIF